MPAARYPWFDDVDRRSTLRQGTRAPTTRRHPPPAQDVEPVGHVARNLPTARAGRVRYLQRVRRIRHGARAPKLPGLGTRLNSKQEKRQEQMDFSNNNDSQSAHDPVREAMQKANLGIRPNYLPLGEGVYEYDRLHWGSSPKSGAERMTIRLVCVEHKADASQVGRVFEHRIDYVGKGNRTLSMVLADFTRFLILPFGADAAKAIESNQVKDLIVNAYKEKFATIINKQGLPGKDKDGNETVSLFKGKRIKLNCVLGEKRATDGKQFTNVYPDVATPAAAA